MVHQRDGDGKSFAIKVNGAPVFMKGANWIPSDSFNERETPERTRFLLQSAVAANMNMLRVWGGGIYEDDRFYELADELGLLIWQDFMFACSMYPGDAAFLDNVRAEASENVRRLRNHPSLALWAGNNEIEAAWLQWGWQAKFHLDKAAQQTIWRDYKRLFHELLPRVVAEQDPGRFYTRSSPSANEDDVPPNKLGWGDNHYWGVWHASAPYTDYPQHLAVHERVRFPVVPFAVVGGALRPAVGVADRLANHALPPAPPARQRAGARPTWIATSNRRRISAGFSTCRRCCRRR